MCCSLLLKRGIYVAHSCYREVYVLLTVVKVGYVLFIVAMDGKKFFFYLLLFYSNCLHILLFIKCMFIMLLMWCNSFVIWTAKK